RDERPSSLILVSAGAPRSLLHRIGLVQGCAESFREFYCIIVGPEVHKEQPWLLRQHMAMNGRHHNAVITKRLNHRIDLFAEQDKISRNGGLSRAGRLKVNGSGCAHRGWHLHSHVVDLFASRDGELVNAVVILALMPECLID